MNDKELLELAAKAAGYTLEEHYDDDQYYPWCVTTDAFWNPLLDDGDALRLAVKLGVRGYFDVEIQKGSVKVTSFSTKWRGKIFAFEPYEHTAYEEFKIRTEDPYAAIRRTIVKAVAEIGREMK